ncbi:DUF1800 family protein [Rudanella paleaurantiibacter]|uniref:DUF1800 family protein n=1 Tax=Rudanella paleaurantiibacter TaxID=2614655 RepID=A0A7J5U3E6_9BACT|nr:DUF1800 family protein [Rudanella paleaurantiibacter]
MLRRSSFGTTSAEVAELVGLTAGQAVGRLVSNANYTVPPPIDLNDAKPTVGQPISTIPYDGDRNSELGYFVSYWWLGVMLGQQQPISLLDKLTLFWQNHFVTTREGVDDYRFIGRYLHLLRTHALGNFRTLLIEVTKDPAMLKYLNGNENEAGSPNENFGRELQELFTVGVLDPAGQYNYTEDDVKAAARVLTGWKFSNYWVSGSTTIGTTFDPTKHDTTDKVFSVHYNHTVIRGRSGPSAGDDELNDLVAMLLARPQTARFICRKLYRWFVNPNVTPDVETAVIEPLALFLASPSNDWAIRPVLEKLLTSEVFFSPQNQGAMIKSPIELVVGTLRLLQLPPPDMVTRPASYRKYMDIFYWRLRDLGQPLLDQPTVFGYEPYYQTGFSKIWINTTTIALRGALIDYLVQGYFEVEPGYRLKPDWVARIEAIQPNFSDVPPLTPTNPPTGTRAVTCEEVVAALLDGVFATDLFASQRDFLIDKIMMQEIPRLSWEFEWNAYRRDPTDSYRRNTVLWRLENLMKFALRMAEYHVV